MNQTWIFAFNGIIWILGLNIRHRCGHRTCLCSCVLRCSSIRCKIGNSGACGYEASGMSLNLRKSWSRLGTGSCWTTLVLIRISGPSSALTCSRQMWERQGTESERRWREKINRCSVSTCRLFKLCSAYLLLYRNMDVDPRTFLPPFDPEYVSNGEIKSTSLQTQGGNLTPGCLPLPTYKGQMTQRNR